MEMLKMRWDMIIAFPPCTDLAASGARYFAQKIADGRQQRSVDFFMKFATANCDKIAIENPVGVMSSKFRKPDQIIQPWQFGHGETKATCLWLKGLSKLMPTEIVEAREPRIWKMPPGPDRARMRSKTYPGIANALWLINGGVVMMSRTDAIRQLQSLRRQAQDRARLRSRLCIQEYMDANTLPLTMWLP
ncbi:MAG: hypothetical protein ACLU9S_22455 [Oscillospiraceae bacterium]